MLKKIDPVMQCIPKNDKMEVNNMFNKLHNWLITLIVGKKPVMMNVDITLAPGTYKINQPILLNKNTNF